MVILMTAVANDFFAHSCNEDVKKKWKKLVLESYMRLKKSSISRQKALKESRVAKNLVRETGTVRWGFVQLVPYSS